MQRFDATYLKGFIMDISFPPGEWPDRMIDPLEISVDVNGVRVRACIDLATLEALNRAGAADAGALRDFANRNLFRFQRAIEAHIFARGIPPNRVVVLGLEELQEQGPG